MDDDLIEAIDEQVPPEQSRSEWVATAARRRLSQEQDVLDRLNELEERLDRVEQKAEGTTPASKRILDRFR